MRPPTTPNARQSPSQPSSSWAQQQMARLKSRVEAQKLHLAATSDRPTADDDRLAKLMNRALKRIGFGSVVVFATYL